MRFEEYPWRGDAYSLLMTIMIKKNNRTFTCSVFSFCWRLGDLPLGCSLSSVRWLTRWFREHFQCLKTNTYGVLAYSYLMYLCDGNKRTHKGHPACARTHIRIYTMRRETYCYWQLLRSNLSSIYIERKKTKQRLRRQEAKKCSFL